MSSGRSTIDNKRASGVLKPGSIASSPSGSVAAVTPKKPAGPPPDTRRSVAPKPGKKKVIELKDNKAVLATDRSETAAFDHDDMQPLEVRRVPDDQVKDLTPAQKTEVFTKVLSATNPKASKNITRFNHKERQFKLESSVDNLVVHFHMNSTLVLADSAEARAQERHSKGISVSTGAGPDEPPRKGLARRNSLVALAAVAAGTTISPDDEEFVPTAPDEEKGRALKNQFNFSERASQTFNNPLRDREAQTEPPPTKDFSGNLTQWAIFDAYLEDFLKQLAAKNAKENTRARSDKEEGKIASNSSDPLDNPALGKAVKLMERMVNQNSEDDTFHDFKFFEDASDFSREDGKGQFLPLWKFQSAKAKRKNVTAIVWNPLYNDLFAAGYGSYEFGKQSSGMICCFSLKNTGHPEYTFTTDSGVMCLDFHPKNPALLVAGLYNGSVCVFDVRSKSNKPIYMSSDPKQKHTDPVWQVHWEDGEAGSKDLKFHSISSDGRITEWTLTKNELSNEEVIELKLVGRAEAKQDEEQPLLGLAGGSCFDFNKRAPNLFVVGTEEGAIQTYSKEYNAQFLESYDGHNMTVYSVRWNPFHSGVFLSCSADWTCKIWKQTSRKPIMTFDLSNSVGDAAWAPYSSTVFATASADGKLRLFDLNVSKHEPIGETKVVKKSRLTHVSFNPREPIVLVGDDNGTVMSFKLSPNLHKMAAPKLEALDPKTETERLDRLLIVEDSEKDASGVKPAVLFA